MALFTHDETTEKITDIPFVDPIKDNENTIDLYECISAIEDMKDNLKTGLESYQILQEEYNSNKELLKSNEDVTQVHVMKTNSIHIFANDILGGSDIKNRVSNEGINDPYKELEIANESIKDTIKKIWEAIKDSFDKIVKFIKKLAEKLGVIKKSREASSNKSYKEIKKLNDSLGKAGKNINSAAKKVIEIEKEQEQNDKELNTLIENMEEILDSLSNSFINDLGILINPNAKSIYEGIKPDNILKQYSKKDSILIDFNDMVNDYIENMWKTLKKDKDDYDSVKKIHDEGIKSIFSMLEKHNKGGELFSNIKDSYKIPGAILLLGSDHAVIADIVDETIVIKKHKVDEKEVKKKIGKLVVGSIPPADAERLMYYINQTIVKVYPLTELNRKPVMEVNPKDIADKNGEINAPSYKLINNYINISNAIVTMAMSSMARYYSSTTNLLSNFGTKYVKSINQLDEFTTILNET